MIKGLRMFFCNFFMRLSLVKSTPYCVTVDFDTLDDNTVAIRDRDTMQQERISIVQLAGYLSKRLI